MDHTENPSAEEPAAPTPTAADVVVSTDENVGDCVVCKEHVRVESRSYRTVGTKYEYVIVCSLCRGSEAIAHDIRQLLENIPRLVKTQLFIDGELIPALRKAGIVPKMVVSAWAGSVTVRPFDREQGMKVAGALGFLLETKNRWKKEQEYQQAFFKLQGQVVRGDFTIDLVISGVAPSEACTIEYEEVEVPARKEKRAKIVCKESEPPTTLP